MASDVAKESGFLVQRMGFASMPSSLRTPKTLSDWLQLDAFKRPRRLRLLHKRFAWLAFVVSVAALAWTFWPSNRWVYQAGPVSRSHLPFDKDCRTCHLESF